MPRRISALDRLIRPFAVAFTLRPARHATTIGIRTKKYMFIMPRLILGQAERAPIRRSVHAMACFFHRMRGVLL